MYVEIICEDLTHNRLAKRKDEISEELRRRKPKRGQDARGREAEIREAQAGVDAQWDEEYAKVLRENAALSPIGLNFLMREYDVSLKNVVFCLHE